MVVCLGGRVYEAFFGLVIDLEVSFLMSNAYQGQCTQGMCICD